MQEVQKTEKRKDTRGRVLRTGESQPPAGSYQFRWSEGGERRTRYAPTLEALRQKEDEIARQRLLGRLSTGGSATVGQLVERHMLLRPNLRERTRRSYRNTIAHLQPDDLWSRKAKDVTVGDCKLYLPYFSKEFQPHRPPSRAVISEWHRLHRAMRLLSTWVPPLDSGRIWWTSSAGVILPARLHCSHNGWAAI